MAKTNTNPKVRFAGFTEDWEERELSKILKERKVMQKITEDAPILAFAAGQGVIDRSERKSNNRDHLTHDQENKIYKLTELNDIVYNPSNLKYGAIDRNKHGRGVISPIYVTFTTDEEPSFVELLVKSEKFKLRALQYEEGTVVKRQSVKPENLISLKVNIATSKDEQKKIGGFFEGIDKLITLHQHKYDKLIMLKHSILNKIYPKKGKDVPLIRFKEFSQPWVPEKLGDISDSFSGGTPSVGISDYYGGKIPFIRSAEINSEVTELFITEKGLNESSAKMVKKGYILYALYGATSGVVGISKINGAINQAILAIIPHTNKDSEFIMNWLRKKRRVIVSTYIQGGQGNLSAGIVKGLEIELPCFEEQQKIGQFLRELDKLISKHKTGLEKLKRIKTACFEKMTSASSKHFEYNN